MIRLILRNRGYAPQSNYIVSETVVSTADAAQAVVDRWAHRKVSRLPAHGAPILVGGDLVQGRVIDLGE